MNPDDQHSRHGHSQHGHDHATGADAASAMDPTFYRSPAEAIAAPREKLAYVVAFDRTAQRPDALTVDSTHGRVDGASR